MRDKVIKWLQNGANAQDGLQLMKQSGASQLTLRLIQSNPAGNKRFMVDYLSKKYEIKNEYSVFCEPEISFKRKSKSFREEFPFLNESNCPVELEALASRKFNKYHAYVDLHKKLRNCTSLGECADVSRSLIESYIENRTIWNELNYYNVHKSLLGKHPIFQEFARRKKLLSLPVKELVLRQQKIENNIWRIKSELKKGNKPHLDVERKERLVGYESELEEVKRLLE